jgi:hypothetical protein
VTKSLAVGAILLGGLLAGVTADRALVQMPAWERIGVIPWANFTRAENHGIGSIFYLVIGLIALPLDRRNGDRIPLRSWRAQLARLSHLLSGGVGDCGGGGNPRRAWAGEFQPEGSGGQCGRLQRRFLIVA